MTDHIPEPGIPEFDYLAQLIAESSFGTLPPDVDDADLQDRIDDSPEQDILLRERIRHTDSDTPGWSTHPLVGSWHTDTDTTTVFDRVGQVFPEADGSIKFDISRLDGRVLYALRGNNQVMRISAADPRLPGGADRAPWALFSFAAQPCHSLLRYGSGEWELEAAIRWQVAEPETALSSGLDELTPELIGLALPRLKLPRTGRGGIDDGGAQMLSLRLTLERLLTDLLAARGITGECAVRLRPWPTTAQADPPGGSAAGMTGNVATNPSSNWPESAVDTSHQPSDIDDNTRLAGPSSASDIGQVSRAYLKRLRQEARRLGESERGTTTPFISGQARPNDLSRLMRRIQASASNRAGNLELPPQLMSLIHATLLPRHHSNYQTVCHAFAVLYECLRADYVMDPLVAESEVSIVIKALYRLSPGYPRNWNIEAPSSELVDFIAEIAVIEIDPVTPASAESGPESKSLPLQLIDVEEARPSPQSKIIHLIDNGMSVEEVADQLDMDPEMVEQYLHEVQDRRRDGRYEFFGVG